MAKKAALFQLGKDLQKAPNLVAKAQKSRKAQAEVKHETAQVVTGPWSESHEQKDHFIVRDGKKYAGTHLIIDLWGASKLDDLKVMEQAMRKAVEVAGATLLHIHLHHFSPTGGISGVAVLSESHISVHTWPEHDYAAFDVFMCGDADPHKAVPVLQKAFRPKRSQVDEILRGSTE